MKLHSHHAFSKVYWLMLPFMLLVGQVGWSQCNFASSFGSGAINPTGAVVTISTCNFGGEYATVTGAVAGQTLRFTSSVGTDWITVRSGTPGGAVLAFGQTPLTFANTFTGTVYPHWSSNAGCGTDFACRTTTVQCTSCGGGGNPCANVPTLQCATPVTATPSGAGVWSPGSCGFSTPGQERVYAFTPVATGAHSLQVTAATGGWIDYFFKAASGGCNATGWTCLQDVIFPTTLSMGTLTAGTTYYVLLDPEGTGSYSHTFQIICPSAAPPCLASPTSPANGANAGCPNTTQTLSWPVSPGATSYDVYFGTSATPPFVANTVGTSYATGSLAQGTYYWQIRPRNAGGAASGCNIWSFVKQDIVAPTIFCPASVVTNNSPATACSAVVTYGAISATDNCTAPNITLVSGLPSGSTFPVGVTTIVYRATDGVGLSNTCSFTVTVNDVTLPNIACPANIAKNNDPGVCGSITTYATPTATDNCGIATVLLQSGLASGALFPVGVTTNVWRATDVNNNTRTCSFTVTVNDTEKPKITCPPNIVKGTDFGDCAAAIPYLGNTVGTDNCFVQSISSNSPGTFQLGTTTVIWIVTDNSSNTASCSQTVTIEDREFPILICPSNVNVKTNVGDCVATVPYSATATDNCSGFTVDYDTNPNSDFDLGLTNVSVTATDAAGNAVSCYFQISVSARPEICNGFDDDCDGLTDEAQDWARIAKQYGSDGATLDEYGVSVAIDGDYAIVGSNKKGPSGQSAGTAYILFRDKNGPNAWGQIAVLTDPGGMPGDNFGASVAISGGVAAVGSPFDDTAIGNEGSVSIFYQSPTNPSQWTYHTKVTIVGPDGGDLMGTSVALSGDQLIAGAIGNDASGANAGAAYVFSRNQGGADTWGQVAKLLATTGNANDNLGISVDIDDKYAIVGANGVDGFQQEVGAAYIFGKNQFGTNTWGQVAKLQAASQNMNDNFGASVAISGPWALVGADRHDRKATDAGAVFAFYKNNNGINDSWGQRNIIIDLNGKTGDRFGCAVGIDGEYAVVGSKGDDDQFGDDSGTGFVYLQQDNGWILMGNLEDGGGKAGDALGSSAAISGRNVILGAPLDDNPGSNMGSVLVYGGLCNDLVNPDDRNVVVTGSEATLRCFPVPFSSVLNIEVKGITSADAQVVVINTLGQTVAQLYNGAIDGEMAFQWRPYQVAAGVYFLRVSTEGKVLTQTIVLNR